MTLKYLKIIGISFLSIILLASCSTTETKAVSISFEAVAAGPFFEGGNSLIAESNMNLNELIGDAEIKPESIESIQLEKATITVLQMENFDAFNNASLSLVSGNSPMQSVAILNPIEGSSKTITLTTSDEAELLSFFKEGKFSLITDLDFKSDDYMEQLAVQVDLNLILHY